MKLLIIAALPIVAFGSTIEEYPDCIIEYAYRRTWIGNGFCNQEYNTEACGWDGGDCLEANAANSPLSPRAAGDGDDEYPDCQVQYAHRQKWIGNGYCNDFLNTPECGYDGGDCLDDSQPDPRAAGGDDATVPLDGARASLITTASSMMIALAIVGTAYGHI